MKTSGNTILVTGGASGIGRGLAESFHKLGNTVIIVGRRQQVLDETIAANPGMLGMVLDVDNAGAIREFARQVVSRHPELNVLINNAGIMRVENLIEQQADLADAEAIITTNLLGPIRLTAALLPHLQKQSHSTIVNVSSGLAFIPLTVTPTYSATKAAIHSYTQSLRFQLRDTNTEVIELIPPGVATELLPGNSGDARMMPLDAFIAESMSLFQKQPTPKEIAVDRVHFLFKAEAEGRYDTSFDALNGATSH